MLRATIHAPGGNLVFTEINREAAFGHYPVMKPGGYNWSISATGEEGLGLQPTGSIVLTDSNNAIATLLLEDNPYLRGRKVEVEDGTITTVRHDWRIDTISTSGKEVRITLVSPVAAAVVQNIPSNPARTIVTRDIGIPSPNAGTQIFMRHIPRRGTDFQGTSSGTYYFRIDDEVVSINASVARSMLARGGTSEFGQTGFNRGQLGTEVSEHEGNTIMTQVPVITGRAGDVIRLLLEAAGSPVGLSNNVHSHLQMYPDTFNIALYDNMQLGEILRDMSIVMGSMLYWNVTTPGIEVVVPGLSNPRVVCYNQSNIVDNPLPRTIQDSKQYTRAQIRAQRRDISEDDYSQISTSIDGAAEGEAQYDRELLYEREVKVFDDPDDDSTRILGAIDAASARIVRRYRDPRNTIEFDGVPDAKLGELVEVDHPSAPGSGRRYQVVGMSQSAERYHRTYRAVSVNPGSPLTTAVDLVNPNYTLRFSTSINNLNLADALRLQEGVLDPAQIKGTITVNLVNSTGGTLYIGGTHETRGAIHVEGFFGATSLTINNPSTQRIIVQGRGGVLNPEQLQLRHGGHAITLRNNGFTTVSRGSNPGNFRFGYGAGGGFSTSIAERSGAFPGRGQGWSSMGFLEATDGTRGRITGDPNINPAGDFVAGDGGRQTSPNYPYSATQAVDSTGRSTRTGNYDVFEGGYGYRYSRGRDGNSIQVI